MTILDDLARILTTTAPKGFQYEPLPEWVETNDNGTETAYFDNFLQASYYAKNSEGPTEIGRMVEGDTLYFSVTREVQ